MEFPPNHYHAFQLSGSTTPCVRFASAKMYFSKEDIQQLMIPLGRALRLLVPANYYVQRA